MSEIPPENELPKEEMPADDQPENPERSMRSGGRGHSTRHRRHPSGTHHRHGRKRFRIEDQPKRSHLRRAERILTKHFLKIIGVFLILGAVYLLINAVTPIGMLWKQLTAKSISVVQVSQYQLVYSDLTPASMITIFIAIVVTLFVLIISLKLKSVEFELVSFSTWLVFGLWLIINLILTGNAVLFYVLIVCGTIFYISFFLGNIFFKSFYNYPKIKKRLETLIILLNSFFYFGMMLFTLHNYGYKEFELLFTVLLLIFNMSAFYIANMRQVSFNKVPYQMFSGVLIAMILPLIFRMNGYILFFSVYSLFAMLYAKYSGHHFSIVFSLLSMGIFFFFYLYYWIFDFFPVAFSKSNIPDVNIFIKGLVASFFVLIPIPVNTGIVKKMHIELSKKWFDLSKYRVILKGMMLVTVFLSLFWVFNYYTTLFFQLQYLKHLLWFAFLLAYFIIVILVLAKQRSSFLPMMFILAVITLLDYPALVHSHVIKIRNIYLESDPSFLAPFIFHYVDLFLVIVLLFTLLRYANRAFKGVKGIIKAYWMFFSMIAMFILFSEFDHLMVIAGYFNGEKIDVIIDQTQRIPYTFLLLLCALVILAFGFIRKSRFLRIYSLVILAVILGKILIIDLPSMQTWAIVMVFLTLGILLLILSFYYSDVKHFFLSKSTTHSHSSRRSHRSHRGGHGLSH